MLILLPLYPKASLDRKIGSLYRWRRLQQGGPNLPEPAVLSERPQHTSYCPRSESDLRHSALC